MFSFLSNNKFKDIDPRAYNSDFFKPKRPHQLIDVRTPGEFKNGHIPGAVNIPLNTLPAAADQLKADTPVIVVCATGNRSRGGANKIANAGFEDVYNITGGTMGWLRQGFKTTKK